MNGGKLNWEERANFHILCPVLLRFMQYFWSRRFCLFGLDEDSGMYKEMVFSSVL